MYKFILILIICLFNFSINAKDIILKPVNLVKLKINDNAFVELNQREGIRYEYYLICETKEKKNVAVRLREAKYQIKANQNMESIKPKESPNIERNALISAELININFSKIIRIRVISSGAELFAIDNYDRDIVKSMFSTWYKVTLKTKEIIDDDYIYMSEKMTKKEFIVLKDNFKIIYVLDCFAKDDYVFTLQKPVKYDPVIKKELALTLD